MLHMVVATHSPDNCPIVDSALRARVLSANKRTDEVTKRLGITVQGSWTNMPAHTMHFLLDAPNAHVIGQMAMELQLMDWNTMIVTSVVTMQDAMTRLQQVSL